MSDWVDKIDINLTGETFTDEHHVDVGASAFALDHDWFWGAADLVIRTAAAGGGTLLVEDTDYELSVEDSDLSTRSGKTVYGRVQITNATYQTGDLYFSGKYIADSNEAADINDLYGIVNSRIGLNDIINGGFRFWQRGTSFAAVGNTDYTADRWKYLKSGAMVHTITRDNDVPDDDMARSLKIDCTTVDSSIAAGDYCMIGQIIEGHNFRKYVGKYGTLQFWVKAPTVGTYCVAFRNTGSDRSYVAEYDVYAADTWEQKTITLEFDYSGGTWNYLNGSGVTITWCLAAGSTYQTTAGEWQTGAYIATADQVNACDNTANNFFLTGVKFELGQKATDFVAGDFPAELERCQRYYEKTYDIDTDPGTVTDLGQIAFRAGSTHAYVRTTLTYLTRKRDVPTPAVYSPDSGTVAKIYNAGASADINGTFVRTGESRTVLSVDNVSVTEGQELQAHVTLAAEL